MTPLSCPGEGDVMNWDFRAILYEVGELLRRPEAENWNIGHV